MPPPVGSTKRGAGSPRAVVTSTRAEFSVIGICRIVFVVAERDVDPLCPDEAAPRDRILLHECEPGDAAVLDLETRRDLGASRLLDPRMAPGRQIVRRPAVEDLDQIRPGRVAERYARSGSHAVRRETTSAPRIISSCRITIGAF